MGAQIFWLGVLALFVTSDQNANWLHNAYGTPTREELSVRQGMSVTVKYGRDLQACEIRIHPSNSSLLMKEPETLMVPELVTEVIDELAPVTERGKGGLKTLSSAGCNQLSVIEFEDVTITRASHECLPLQPAREFPATLIFKKPECAGIEQARLARKE